MAMQPSEQHSPRTVVLFGKLGHGKTHLINKICGTDFTSHMAAQSCTRSLQSGCSRNHGITVIDTPGFYSSDDVVHHTAEQKAAMEGRQLSGIYVVVKLGRSDDMAETLNKVMDFVGDDDVRAIITHTDTVDHTQGDHQGAMMQSITRLSELLEMPPQNIFAIGKDTDAYAIEEFIASTLHAPREYEVTKEQVASVSTLCVGARKFDQAIAETNAKIGAAAIACQKLRECSRGFSFHTNFAIRVTRKQTETMVEKSQSGIFHNAQELTPEQLLLLREKLRDSITLPLADFLSATTGCLPHAGRAQKQPFQYSSLNVRFSKVASRWLVQYSIDGVDTPTEQVPMKLIESRQGTGAKSTTRSNNKRNHHHVQQQDRKSGQGNAKGLDRTHEESRPYKKATSVQVTETQKSQTTLTTGGNATLGAKTGKINASSSGRHRSSFHQQAQQHDPKSNLRQAREEDPSQAAQGTNNKCAILSDDPSYPHGRRQAIHAESGPVPCGKATFEAGSGGAVDIESAFPQLDLVLNLRNRKSISKESSPCVQEDYYSNEKPEPTTRNAVNGSRQTWSAWIRRWCRIFSSAFCSCPCALPGFLGVTKATTTQDQSSPMIHQEEEGDSTVDLKVAAK